MKYFSILVPFLLLLCWIIAYWLQPGSEKNMIFLGLSMLATEPFLRSSKAK